MKDVKNAMNVGLLISRNANNGGFIMTKSVNFYVIISACVLLSLGCDSSLPVKQQTPLNVKGLMPYIASIPEPVKVDPLPQLKTINPDSLNKSERGELPVYDINTEPISFWVLKNSAGKNVGFIVAGHAEKSICKIASIEVMTKLKEMGKNDNSLFSFGIGYDFRDKSPLWTESYHQLVGKMEEKFRSLEKEYPESVVVNNIDIDKYKQVIRTIKSNLRNDISGWDTHIAEYKYFDSPVIVPFYRIGTGEEITIRLKKAEFGTTPHGMALNSFKQEIAIAIKEVQALINENNNTLNQIRKNFTGSLSIIINSIKGNFFYKETSELNNDPPAPPDDFYITDGYSITRAITLDEAISYLENGGAIISDNARKELNSWIAISKEHEKSLKIKKEEIKRKITDANKLMEYKIKEIKSLYEKISKQNDESLLIDAFLRGWPFGTDDVQYNAQLDRWYDQRKKVWNTILNQIDGSRVNDKLGGVFHLDNVFFKVVADGDYYQITPYHILGGKFIQVINTKSGICQFLTPYNFRRSER